MSRIITSLFTFILFWNSCIWAQPSGNQLNREAGLPFVQNFDEAERRTYIVAQGPQGFMYLITGKAIHEFNGVSPVVNNLDNWGSIFALVVDKEEGLSYIGGEGELGYITVVDSSYTQGYISFFSLMNYVPQAYRDFSAIQNIVIGEDAIYFATNGTSFGKKRYVFRLKKRAKYTPDQIAPEDSMFVWKIENYFTLWGGPSGIYVQERYFGLKQIVGDSLIMAPGGDQLKTNRIRLFIPLNDPENDSDLKILTNTAPGDLAIYENGTVTPFPVEPKLLAYLQKNRIDNAIKLSNGHIAIATDYDGGLIMDQQGRWIQSLNKEIGLKSETIHAMYEDTQRGLWLGTQKGTSRVEVLSPMTHYLESHGYVGEVKNFVKHQGVIYILTRNDLLYLSTSDDPEKLPSMEIIDEGNVGNRFLSVGKDLLMGGRQGIYQIVNQEVERLPMDINGISVMFLSPFDSTLIYVGTDGPIVGILKKWEDNWHYIGQFELIESGINSIVEESPGKLWAGTSADGVFQIEIPESSFKLIKHWTPEDNILENIPVEFKQYTYEEYDLPKGHVLVRSIAGQTVFKTTFEIQRFNDSTQMIESETSFGADQFDEDYIVSEIDEDNRGNVYLYIIGKSWGAKLRQIAISRLDKNGNWQVKSTQLNRMPISFQENFPFIYPDPDDPQVIWLYAKDGIVRYDASLETKDFRPTDFSAHMRFVTSESQDSSPIHQSRSHQFLNMYQDHNSPLILGYENKYFDFTYFSTAFDDISENSYQVILEGYDNSWSDWTDETHKLYTRLPEGDYTFKVRARNVYNQISEEAVLAFRVKPPWHRSWWAYTIYGTLLILFVGAVAYFYNKWQTRLLEARNRQLEQTVDQRTVEIRERNEEIQTKNIQLEETLDNLQKTQQQLILQEKMASLGQMTAGIAHEIKNPLNFVTNFAESSVELAEELKEELGELLESQNAEYRQLLTEILEDLKENAITIHQNGQRANGIVSGMMEHANDNLGEKRETNLNMLIKTQAQFALDGYEAKLENFEVAVQQDFDESLPPITINPQEIGRMIINLVNNACYALEEKTRISENGFTPEINISTQQLEDTIEIRIRDNGLGIPTDIRDNIFTPFFTTKPTGFGNTGLGLSLSYDIITQGHQGTIICESEDGKFTEFVISLPNFIA